MFTIEIILLSKSIDLISYLESNVDVIINAVSDVYLTNMGRELMLFGSWLKINCDKEMVVTQLTY